jgi:hypothetical protein
MAGNTVESMHDVCCWEDDYFYQSLVSRSLPSNDFRNVTSSVIALISIARQWDTPLAESLEWLYHYAVDHSYGPERDLDLAFSRYKWFCHDIVMIWRHGSIENGDRASDFQRYGLMGFTGLARATYKIEIIDWLAYWHISVVPFLKTLLDSLRLFFCLAFRYFLVILMHCYRRTSWVETNFAVYLTIRPPTIPLAIWRC